MPDERECFCIKCGLSDPASNMETLYVGKEDDAEEAWVHTECLVQYRVSTGMYNLERLKDFLKSKGKL